MKANNDFHCSSHPSDPDRHQTSSSQLKDLEQLRAQVCPYCVNSDSSGSSANSSPSITPLVSAIINRDSHLSHLDDKPAAQSKNTSQSGYPTGAGSHGPSSLKPISGSRPAHKPAKGTAVPKMPSCPTNNTATGRGALKNSTRSAVPKSAASLRNESDNSSYVTSDSRTRAPADSKLSAKNLTRTFPSKTSSVSHFSESARTTKSVAQHQPVPPVYGRSYTTQLPPSFYVQQTGSSRKHITGKRPEELQSLANDPVSHHQQTTSDLPNVQSSSTGTEPSSSNRVGAQIDTSSYPIDLPLTYSSLLLPNTQQQTNQTTGLALTNQPRSGQPYRGGGSQHPDNKSGPLPPQSTSKPTLNNSTPQESSVKSVFQQFDTKKPTTGNADKSKPFKIENTEALALPEARGRASPTKVEFSKLQTGSPGMVSSNRPHSKDKQIKERLSPTDKDAKGAPYQTTTRRPMQRCTNSSQSDSTCTPEDNSRTSAKQATNQQSAEHSQKSTLQYTARPLQLVFRQTRPTSRQPAQATQSQTKSTTRFAQSASRPLWNRYASSSLSINDVGADGSRAYTIRKEHRGKVDWRRKPRYKVKQTTTSRLRYGYWFADCGRQRVKAYRGDWSQIPPEMLRDWEVYQNYFRYRAKGHRKRTSSLVRKFIAGKYHHKRIPSSQKRPIRKMSPLLLSNQSPPKTDSSGGSAKRKTAGTETAVDDDPNAPPPIRGANVRNLLMRRAQAQLRQRESVQKVRPPRPFDVYQKPHIHVRSTITSRLRKSSLLQSCGKPVTPTLWHGSTGEMEDLVQKIAHRRQRLKDNWLKQTSALMNLSLHSGVEGTERDDRVTQMMAHLMVVGAPPTKRIGAVSEQCANAALKTVRRRSSAAKMPAHEGRKRRNCSTTSAYVAQHLIKQQLPAIPETDWSTSSSQSDTSSGTVAPVTNFCQPSSMMRESSPPVGSALEHQNRPVKKKKPFMAVRRVLSLARWLIAPVIPTKQNATSTKRQEISEKRDI